MFLSFVYTGFCEMFDTLDNDGSGTLTFEELKQGGMKEGVRVLGQNATDEEIQQFLTAVDADGNLYTLSTYTLTNYSL